MTEPEPTIKVTFRLLTKNYDKLWTAAAAEGASFEVIMNRAVGLYEGLHRSEPYQVASWQTVQGEEREVLVLPTKNRGSLLLRIWRLVIFWEQR